MKLVLIKSKRDFEKNRYNKRFFGKYLKINVNTRSQLQGPRFAIIIPKTILKKVVDRNKIKRRIKYYLTQRVESIHSADILFFVTPRIISVKYAEVAQDIDQVLTKGGLWKKLP